MKLFKNFLICIIISACTNLNNKGKSYYEKYVSKELKEYGSSNFTGKIVALSNDACHKCAEWVIDNNKDFDENTILYYDTTVYKNKPIKDSKHKVIFSTTDFLSKLRFQNVYGHRIYSVVNGEIVKTKEVNSMNADSILFFLDIK